jgi:hypothetical protein
MRLLRCTTISSSSRLRVQLLLVPVSRVHSRAVAACLLLLLQQLDPLLRQWLLCCSACLLHLAFDSNSSSSSSHSTWQASWQLVSNSSSRLQLHLPLMLVPPVRRCCCQCQLHLLLGTHSQQVAAMHQLAACQCSSSQCMAVSQVPSGHQQPFLSTARVLSLQQQQRSNAQCFWRALAVADRLVEQGTLRLQALLLLQLQWLLQVLLERTQLGAWCICCRLSSRL